MKNALILLLFILAFSSCRIEKRRYFRGYYVENGAPRYISPEARHSGTGEREKVGEWENGAPRYNSPAVNHSGTGEVSTEMSPIDSVSQAEIQSVPQEQGTPGSAHKPQRGDIVITGDRIKTTHEDVITAHAPLPIQHPTRVMGHKKSHALEGLGAIFLVGIITVVLIVGLLIYLFTGSAVFSVIGALFVGLITAIGIYILIMLLFFALLLFIIKSFGA